MITPVIVGVGQYTQRKETTEPLDPLRLIVKSSKKALNDVGTNGIINYIDSVYMINIFSWSYEDAPAELSEILGIKPKNKVFLPDGGNTPQMLVNRAAKAIRSGKSTAVLIAGGEASYSARLAEKNEINWPEKKEPNYMEGDMWDGINKFINSYGVKTPPYCYAFFETALRVASGRTIEEHKKHMGKIFEHYSKIASENTYSWTKKPYTAEEITNPSEKNRYINHPYTKRMCSNMFVDQSASIVITSEAIAEELGIDKKKRVYLMGCSDLKNLHDITKRPKLYNSPAAREGSRLVLDRAGLTINEIDKFEIYSCFPVIVEIIANEIGIPENDPRDLTITGGNPFFGGPWSNFSTHSIIGAIEQVRKNLQSKIMVVANGGYNSKQSFGVYSNTPSAMPWSDSKEEKIQQTILDDSLPEPVKEAKGKLTIDGYTITYDRTGKPKRAMVIGMLEDGRRTLANIIANQEDLLKYEHQELVGRTCIVNYDSKSGRNVATLIK